MPVSSRSYRGQTRCRIVVALSDSVMDVSSKNRLALQLLVLLSPRDSSNELSIWEPPE